MLSCVVILLGHLLMMEALVITPARHLYDADTWSRREDLSNLTKRLESLEERVESILQNFCKSVDSNTESLKRQTTSTDNLETRVNTNTENIRLQNTSLHNLVDTNRENIQLQTAFLDNLDRRAESNTENIQLETASLGKLDERVDTNTDNLQALRTDHTERAKSTDKRLKALEENLLQLKTRVEEHHTVPDCPSKFILNENPKLCFKTMHDQTSSQKEKNIRCSQLVEGGRLLQLETSEKLDVVKQYLTDKALKSDFIIGGMLSQSTNTWIWLDGTHLDLTLFCPGEPSGGNILSMYSYREYCLDDVYDDNNGQKFICEMPM